MTEDERIYDTDYKDNADEHRTEVAVSRPGKRRTTAVDSPAQSEEDECAKCDPYHTRYHNKVRAIDDILAMDPVFDLKQARIDAPVTPQRKESSTHIPPLLDTDSRMHKNKVLQNAYYPNTTHVRKITREVESMPIFGPN
jgi:hypothetical protein